jgi:hypothetical protein
MAAIPSIGLDARAPVLHAALQADPGFFAELVGLVFRADNVSTAREN